MQKNAVLSFKGPSPPSVLSFLFFSLCWCFVMKVTMTGILFAIWWHLSFLGLSAYSFGWCLIYHSFKKVLLYHFILFFLRLQNHPNNLKCTYNWETFEECMLILLSTVDQKFPFDLSVFEMMMHQTWKECANENLTLKKTQSKLQEIRFLTFFCSSQLRCTSW